jgi:hypothetical protein
MCASATVSATLDANGNVPSGALSLYPNAYLTNDSRGLQTVYKLKVYAVGDQLAWQQDATITDQGGVFDLNSLIP